MDLQSPIDWIYSSNAIDNNESNEKHKLIYSNFDLQCNCESIAWKAENVHSNTSFCELHCNDVDGGNNDSNNIDCWPVVLTKSFVFRSNV